MRNWLQIAVFAALALAPLSRGYAEEKKPVVAGIIFQDDQFFQLMALGMKEAAAKGGAEFILGNSNNRADKETQLIDSYMARKVDAIVMSPISTKASAAAVNRAIKAGVKVVLTNSACEGASPVSVIQADQAELGARTGEIARKYIEQKLGGKAKVAILAYKSQLAEQSDARTNGFKQEIMKLPGVQVVAEQDAWLTEMAVKKGGDILTANPDVNIMWSANEGGTVGAVLAVKGAGKQDKVAVFGSAVSKQLLDFLESKDDILQAVSTQKPYEMAGAGVETALKALKGKPVEKEQVFKNMSLSRSDPEGIKAYRKQLEEMMSKGRN